MLIKGTRMIVITKNKLLAITGLVLLSAVCAFCIKFTASKKNVTAFSEYKSILNSQIIPGKNTESENSSNVSNSENISDEKEEFKIWKQILNGFFVISEKEKESEAEQAEFTPEPTEKPEKKITSEAKRGVGGMKVSNSTSYDVKPEDFANMALPFSIERDKGPQVLIMHTHTTESYSEEVYAPGAPDRNLDEKLNVSDVGGKMAEIFREKGIDVMHDMTVHDYPSYNGAYQRAATTIKNNLNKYGGIKVVLDVHRDGITRDDGTKVKLVTDINGEAVAQVMLVVGTNVNLQHDKWTENFKFASKIQAKAAEKYPTLMRPINLRQERFNEQLTTGSLIVEIGTNGNTLAEAERGGKYIAEIIADVLNEAD